MCNYVNGIIHAWDKAMNTDSFVVVKKAKSKTAAAPEDLFKVDDDIEKLNSTMATAFHNIVAKTLFITKRSRPDTSTSIAFLMMRVREPNQDEWRKLGHLMEYLCKTIDMPLVLGANASSH